MKNTKILVFAAFMSPVIAKSQSHSLEVGVGGYKLFNVAMQQEDKINMAHIRYVFRLNDKFRLYGQYTCLPLKGWLLAEMEDALAMKSIGKLVQHMKYNCYDIGAQYKFLQVHQHSISATAAISLAYGKDRYLTNVVWTEPEPGEPYGHPIFTEYKEKTGMYIGGSGGIKYDYHIWKNKINLGADLSARYYVNKFPFQVNYAVHIGYNF